MPSGVKKMAADDNPTPAHAMVIFSRGHLPLGARVLTCWLPQYSRTWAASLKTVLSVFHQALWVSIVLGGLVGGLNGGNTALARGDHRSLVQPHRGKNAPTPGV